MNAAKALGSDEVGIITSGRRADLVLLTANPLEAIGNTHCRIVSRGEVIR